MCAYFFIKVLNTFCKKNFVLIGQYHRQPRLTAWFGDFPYEYSGLTLKPFQVGKKEIAFVAITWLIGEQYVYEQYAYEHQVIFQQYRLYR